MENNKEPLLYSKCPDCGGDGYTAEHDNHPHEGGDCQGMCPVQVQCERCQATGFIEWLEPYTPPVAPEAAPVKSAESGKPTKDDEIWALKKIVEIKEKERTAWAEMCIKKQARIEELEKQLKGQDHGKA